MSLMKSARTVLLISDQALYIFATNARNSQLVEVVPWTAQDFEQSVASIISKECGNSPILILNDMVEQHYRKEKIPKVSIMDKANVVERKLMVSFPNYPIRASLPLKEKIGKNDKKSSGSLFIFAAVPSSEPFTKTMGAARQSSAPIAGFCLLPVESSGMVKKLSEKVFPKEKSKWTVFIGYHQSGGLRQIVIKNGELALTRMTPVSDIGDDSSLWISEVNQEFSATMSYLARFGFDSSDGLNVIMIAPEEAGEKMQALITTPCNFRSLTPAQAAKFLGISLKDSDTSHYADELHAAWSGTKGPLQMPLRVKDLESVSRPRQIAILLSLMLFLGLSFQLYQYFGYFQSLQSNLEEIDLATKRKSELDIQHQKEQKRKDDLGFDLNLIQSAIAVNNELLRLKIDVLDLFYQIDMALGQDMRIDMIRLERQDVKKQEQKQIEAGQPPGPKLLYLATMRMSFPSTIDAEKGNKRVERMKADIQQNIMDSVVKITKLVEDYKYSEGLVVQTGQAGNVSAAQDYISEIVIEKQIP